MVAFFMPMAPGQVEFIWQDKAVHLTVFAALAGFFLAAKPRWRLLIIGLLIGYAIDSEIIQQLFVPGRTFQLTDLLADAVGILAGERIITYVHPRH
ncbi:MAG: VanZ family protein [Patescibacteria group bacterium]